MAPVNWDRAFKQHKDNKFKAIFTLYVERIQLSRDDLADILLVSRPTISRWLVGKNLPHEAMRDSILKRMEEIIMDQDEED